MSIRMTSRRRVMLREEPARRRGLSVKALVLVVNGVIASVGGVYVATQSIPATVVSGTLGVILAGWLAALKR